MTLWQWISLIQPQRLVKVRFCHQECRTCTLATDHFDTDSAVRFCLQERVTRTLATDHFDIDSAVRFCHQERVTHTLAVDHFNADPDGAWKRWAL